MKTLRAWAMRLAGLWPSAHRERELDDEIASHLEMHIADSIRAGMSPAEARRAALWKLGGLDSAKEAYRDRRTVPLLENFLRDLRCALRQLRRNPGFTAAAVLVLGLGICASVAIFAFVDATLIRPLPYRQPERLAALFETVPLCPRCPLSYADYLDWKRLNTVFSSTEAFDGTHFSLPTNQGAQMAGGAWVTAGFFRTLGVSPVLGRDFRPAEDSPGAPRTVMLSYAAWQARYAGARDVLGKTVVLDGASHLIIGVLPSSFYFAAVGPAEFWSALHADAGCFLQRGCHSLHGLARLKDGTPVTAADAQIKSIAANLEKQYTTNRGQGGSVVPLLEVELGRFRPILIVLLSASALLLLIACVNVTSLVLVRAETRKREMALRSALGGSRWRLASQFSTEALVLVGAAAVIGVLAARSLVPLLLAMVGQDQLAAMPFLTGIGLNARVLLFALLVALSAAAILSIVPAWRSHTPDLRAGLAEGGRGSSGTVWRRLGAHLVVLELAAAMILLVGAALLGQSFYRLLHVDLGIQANGLASVRIAGPGNIQNDNPRMVRFARDIVSQAEAIPGVQSAAVSSMLPANGGNTMWIRVIGRPYHGEHNEVGYREVSPAYFTTLRAKLFRGRYFTAADDATKPPVVIIDRAFADKYFPGEDPIGKHMAYASDHSPAMEVVGMVENIREGALDTDTWPTMYVAFAQDPTGYFSLVVRTAQAEDAILPTLAAAIHRIDPGAAAYLPRTMRAIIDGTPAAYLHRCAAWLAAGFALMALLLGAAGIYGVIAYSASRRTREIGVRMALGAQRRAVYGLILKEAAWLIAAGTALGLIGSAATATLLEGLLFGVRPLDPGTYALVAALLGATGLLASFLPARRAASIDPVEALRAE